MYRLDVGWTVDVMDYLAAGFGKRRKLDKTIYTTSRFISRILFILGLETVTVDGQETDKNA